MKSICKALLNLANYVHAADDSLIDYASSVRALKQLVSDLNAGDSGEREYLKGIMRQEIGCFEELSEEDQYRVDFYLDLIEQLD